MAATIHDLHEELEVLNQTMTTLLSLQQTQQMQRESVGPGAGGGDDTKSVIMSMVTQGMKQPWEAIGDKATKLIAMGAHMVNSVDSLEYSTMSDARNTRAQIALLLTESSYAEGGRNLGRQIGGVLENVATMNNALQVGISLDKESDKRLRNQLTILDKQGAQGQMLLNFTKDLMGMGFTRADARESLQHLADIGFYSIQNAQNQANMLKKMSEFMGITFLQNPKLGKDMKDMLEMTLMDVDPTKQNAFLDQMKLALFPEGDDIGYRQMLGGADEFADNIKRLSAEFASQADKPILQKKTLEELMSLSDIFAQQRLDVAKSLLSDDEVARASQLQVPLMSTVAKGIVEANNARAASDTQRAIDTNRLESAILFAYPMSSEGMVVSKAFEFAMQITKDSLPSTAERMFQKSLESLDPVSKAMQEHISTTIEPLAAGMAVGFGEALFWLNAFTEGLADAVRRIPGNFVPDFIENILSDNGGYRLGTRQQQLEQLNRSAPLRALYNDWPRRDLYPGDFGEGASIF